MFTLKRFRKEKKVNINKSQPKKNESLNYISTQILVAKSRAYAVAYGCKKEVDSTPSTAV